MILKHIGLMCNGSSNKYLPCVSKMCALKIRLVFRAYVATKNGNDIDKTLDVVACL